MALNGALLHDVWGVVVRPGRGLRFGDVGRGDEALLHWRGDGLDEGPSVLARAEVGCRWVVVSSKRYCLCMGRGGWGGGGFGAPEALTMSESATESSPSSSAWKEYSTLYSRVAI